MTRIDREHRHGGVVLEHLGQLALARVVAAELTRAEESSQRSSSALVLPLHNREDMSERQDIDAFLACKRIAFVGVSTNEKHFSRAVMRELVAHGIDVVPVHPGVAQIDGRRAFARVPEIDAKVEGALIMTPASASAAVIADCARAGVRRVWLHRGVGPGAASEESLVAARAHDMIVVADRCPLMFLDKHLGQPHRLHAGIVKLLRQYPA